MTYEEYFTNRIAKLEKENEQLKREIENLENNKRVVFVLKSPYDACGTYKVDLNKDGSIKVYKE